MKFKTLDRITQNPAVMGGKPCVRGMRLTVGMILSQLSAGESIDELLADFPYLEREDILQSIAAGALLMDDNIKNYNVSELAATA